MVEFKLNDVEEARCNVFKDKHKNCAPKGFTALGMQYTYTITPGGFGPLVTIKCNACGKSEDVTDIDSW